MERRAEWVPHILLERFGRQRYFEPVSSGGSSITLPPVVRREQYRKIRDALRAAAAQAEEQFAARDPGLAQDDPGIYLAFKTYDAAFDPAKFMVDGRELTLVRPELGRRRGAFGQQVLRYRGVTLVPQRELAKLQRKVQKYGEGPPTKNGNPPNAALVGVLEDLRLASFEDLWTDVAPPPPDDAEMRLWEVWVRDTGARRFSTIADRLGIAVEDAKLTLPSRQVQWVHATREQMERVVLNSETVAELRSGASRLAQHELDRRARTFAGFAAADVVPPPEDAPSVCVLDTGTLAGHPYLQPGIRAGAAISADPAWNAADVSRSGHGTAVSGIALYGQDLRLVAGPNVALSHQLESVKIIQEAGGLTTSLALLTKNAVSRIEIANVARRRVFCITSTTTEEGSATPTTWSMAVDSLSAEWNAQRLFVVAAGNVAAEHHRQHEYPDSNDLRPITQPGQAYNALTVGGYTDFAELLDPTHAGYVPLAQAGDLSPHSRTATLWHGRAWKPDIVMEAGNLAAPPNGIHTAVDELQLLSTYNNPQLTFRTFDATSAAAPQAAALAADILASNNRFWPETARALIAHHADWTPRMRQLVDQGLDRRVALRRWGYGVPSRAAALRSTRDRLTIIVQDQLQPYHLVERKGKHNQMSLHLFPLPMEALQRLGEMHFVLRYTLSYFVEPLPPPVDAGGYYHSHTLRVRLGAPNESEAHFLGRINKADKRPGERYAGGPGDQWGYGADIFPGSLVSDYVVATAAELAARGKLAVVPQVGWWRERLVEERVDHPARYSLVVSLRPLIATEVEIDLHTPVLEALAEAGIEGIVIDGQ